MLAQLLAVVTDVPALQIGAALLGGEGLQLLQVLNGEGFAALRQVAQEVQHLVRGFGHLGRQAQIGVAGKTEQLGQFLAQAENLLHHRAVVVLAGVRPLIRGAGTVGGVQLFAQGAVVGVGHHREVAGELQADQPAVEVLGLGCLGHLRLGRVGQAGQRRFIGDVLGPGLGGIQQLVGEAAGQLGQLHLDGAIALLLGLRQIDAGQMKVAQGVFQDGRLRHLERGRIGTSGQRVIGLVQRTVLPQFGPVLGQLGQASLVGGAQFGVVAHRIQVADRSPGAAKAIIQFVEHQHQTIPARCARLFTQEFADRCAVIGENRIHRRLDMLGPDS